MKRTTFHLALAGVLSMTSLAPTFSATAQVTVDNIEATPITVVGSSGFIVSLKERNSYCCTMVPANASSNITMDSAVQREDDAMTTVPGALRGNMEPAVTIPDFLPDTDAANNRVCVMISDSINYKFPVMTGAMGSDAVSVSCNSTTLNGGFNTNGTPFNFLECTNRSDAPIDAKVFLVNFAGETVVNGSPVTIPAGLRSDIAGHTAGGDGQLGGLFAT